MESPQSGQKRNREPWEGKELVDSTGWVPCTTSRAIGSPKRMQQFPELEDDEDAFHEVDESVHEEDDPIPAHARVGPQFEPPQSFYEQALEQQRRNRRDRELREQLEKEGLDDPLSRDNQYRCAKATAQQVLDSAIAYANDRAAKHAISRDTLFAQHVSVQMLSLKADWATTVDYTNELDNIGNEMNNIGSAIETLATAVEGIDIPHAFDCADGSMIASGAQRLADAMATIANAMDR